MEKKHYLFAAAILSIAGIIAAAVSTGNAGLGWGQSGRLLEGSPVPSAAAHNGEAAASPLNTTLSGLPVPAPAPEVAKLSPAQMKEDLDSLTDTLVKVHPRLIDGWTAEEQQVIEAAYAKADQPRTPGEFYFIADSIATLLHDAHTVLYSPTVNKYLDIPLFWSREGLVVTDKRGQLLPGDLVTDIGGRSISELEAELSSVISAENDIWVKERGQSLLRTEQFLNYLGLISDQHTVEITVMRGSQSLAQSFELTDSSGQAEYNPFPKYNTDFTFEMDKKRSLGIFQLNSCVNSEDYKATLQRFFNEVHTQGITNVAVDLRNNGGGDSSVVSEFLTYTDIKEYRSFKSEIRYSPQVKQQRPGSPDHGVAVNEAEIITNALQTEYPFSGNLYVLTSPRTFSSANMFALIVQDNKLGQLIGQATGNKPSSYGDYLSFRLPASGISYIVSHKKFTRPDPSRDPASAVIPDIEAYTTARDIIDRRDAQMEKLYEVIGQNQPAAASKLN
ncbi:S41 family peptidase [Paenibacillus sp. MMS20-IR301]|uniref:S41 family peptidase n=1 Tax=Paenibacillus sp. MMS20-IR301 TaxID=2895946 RepID=UPI0028E5C90F|nr:S41 family peptidase [Paenibacillus sp. MMS20-IR301]WNS44840.1 S41 family peptidase [Paenibacillus sp. MMS20-IR301]